MKKGIRDMKEANDFGLSPEILSRLIGTVRKNKNVEKIILYGSRAKGNFRAFSDIDLTLTGDNLIHTDLFGIMEDIEELCLPYEIDLSLMSEIDNPALLAEIEKDGYIL